MKHNGQFGRVWTLKHILFALMTTLLLTKVHERSFVVCSQNVPSSSVFFFCNVSFSRELWLCHICVLLPNLDEERNDCQHLTKPSIISAHTTCLAPNKLVHAAISHGSTRNKNTTNYAGNPYLANLQSTASTCRCPRRSRWTRPSEPCCRSMFWYPRWLSVCPTQQLLPHILHLQLQEESYFEP